jgi:hypothetical protein
MILGRSGINFPLLRASLVSVGLALAACGSYAAPSPADAPAKPAPPVAPACVAPVEDSPYIPVDSWIYPAVLRLYSMGYLHTVFLGERPWTRASVSHMLDETGPIIDDADQYNEPTAPEARDIYNTLLSELHYNAVASCFIAEGNIHPESVYSATRVISGTSLRDSFHLGSTIVNDYGRPYENGVNNYSGASGYATAGRFLLYVRGEFQGAPSATGYSTLPGQIGQTLSTVDSLLFYIPGTDTPYYQATMPLGNINTATRGRLLEAYASTHLLKHVISFGKQDEWLSPAQGGAMAYSNNAENIWALHINRIEPLRVPLLSRLTGPFRYEFLVGALQGHTYIPATDPNCTNDGNYLGCVNPGKPWVHLEKISFKPTQDLEFGFERTVIWGGQGHEGISLHSFLRSFFSLTAPQGNTKNSNQDPGARFGAANFSYRLPYLRHWLTLYADGEVHDDISPLDAPRRAAWRPGLYLSHLPGLPKLDLRVEAADTDPPVSRSQSGQFMYWEGIVRQGYTNNGQLFGDWMGREDKGGQAWITYHLSPSEQIQVSVRNQKAANDFIPGGTTLNDIDFQAAKRIGKDFEIDGKFTLEHWKAPAYLPGQQTVTATTIQLTWFPKAKLSLR